MPPMHTKGEMIERVAEIREELRILEEALAEMKDGQIRCEKCGVIEEKRNIYGSYCHCDNDD